MILVYTVSDFKPQADQCINMMVDSLKKDNFDFCVITNKNPPSNFKHNVVVDTNNYDYVGFLKYSEKIPENYDYYVYLDSDILCFEKPSNLITKKKFSSVLEGRAFGNKLKSNSHWHKYNFCSFDQKQKLLKFPDLNAGFFSFKKSELDFIKQVKVFFESHVSLISHKNAMLEQSSFNYAIAQYCDFDISNIEDFSDFVVMFADGSTKFSNKYIYHFCGFTNEMKSKQRLMKKFLCKI